MREQELRDAGLWDWQMVEVEGFLPDPADGGVTWYSPTLPQPQPQLRDGSPARGAHRTDDNAEGSAAEK